jgi:hypothetical protein
MPSENEVPSGAHRDLLREIFHMYRLAGRPVLRDIVAQAKQMDLTGTASQETIRRVLKGTTVPERWDTMYAVYAPLCAIADIDPDALYEEEHGGYDGPEVVTHKEVLKRRWNSVVDGDDVAHYVPSRTKVEPRSTPGAQSLPYDLSDEPPF